MIGDSARRRRSYPSFPEQRRRFGRRRFPETLGEFAAQAEEAQGSQVTGIYRRDAIGGQLIQQESIVGRSSLKTRITQSRVRVGPTGNAARR